MRIALRPRVHKHLVVLVVVQVFLDPVHLSVLRQVVLSHGPVVAVVHLWVICLANVQNVVSLRKFLRLCLARTSRTPTLGRAGLLSRRPPYTAKA